MQLNSLVLRPSYAKETSHWFVRKGERSMLNLAVTTLTVLLAIHAACGNAYVPVSASDNPNGARYPELICPNGNTKCPDDSTWEHPWLCCPLPEAVCCKNNYYCCEKGYTCNSTTDTCMPPVLRRGVGQSKRRLVPLQLQNLS